MAHIEPITVFSGQPADITPDIWLTLAKTINQRFKDTDGFVIFHGPDNVLFTAAALSFLFKNLTKPIIFTGGSITPQADRRLEMRANFINAIQAASYTFSEVGLMFGNRFIRANQATRVESDSLAMFTAPVSGMLGRIDFSIRLAEKIIRKNRGATKLVETPNTNIEIIALSPFLDLKALAQRLPSRAGVIINAGAYEYIPASLRATLEKSAPEIPVVIWSHKIASSPLIPKNMIIVHNMTWEATVTKFMALRGETGSLGKLKQQMATDVAGEIITSL